MPGETKAEPQGVCCGGAMGAAAPKGTGAAPRAQAAVGRTAEVGWTAGTDQELVWWG